MCRKPEVRYLPRAPKRTAGVRLVLLGSNLDLAITWSEEIPQNQTQQRQQHHDQYPNQFPFVGSGALNDVDYRPDVASKYQQAPKTIVSNVHFLDPFCGIGSLQCRPFV